MIRRINMGFYWEIVYKLPNSCLQKDKYWDVFRLLWELSDKVDMDCCIQKRNNHRLDEF